MDNTYKPSPSCSNKLLQVLNDFSNSLNLNQIIRKPTHKEGNVLDFLLTNNSESIYNYHCLPTLWSDHFIVSISSHFVLETTTNHENSPKIMNSPFDNLNFYDYSKINWQELNNKLDNVDWKSLLGESISHPEQQFKLFYDTCIDIVTKYVPQKCQTKKAFKSIPRDRRILMRKRTKLTKRFSVEFNQNKKNILKEKLIDIEILLQKSHYTEKKQCELNATNKIKSNPKYFYSYAKRYSKTKPKVGPLRDPKTSRLTSNPGEMADLLQQQFKFVFSKPLDDYSHIADSTPICENLINDIEFNIQDIIDEIDTIPPNSAAGPDGIPAIFIKQCKKSIALPLQILWRNCLDKGYTPTILKTNFITPIFKDGDQGSALNYRPVALTSHLTKIFEKIVRKQLVNFLDENKLFNDSQHGFRNGRSCLSQFLEHTERILSYPILNKTRM